MDNDRCQTHLIKGEYNVKFLDRYPKEKYFFYSLTEGHRLKFDSKRVVNKLNPVFVWDEGSNSYRMSKKFMGVLG